MLSRRAYLGEAARAYLLCFARHFALSAAPLTTRATALRPKASCLRVASGRHGASLRRAGGCEGCRPLQVAVLTRRFRATLQRCAALPLARARPSSVCADGRAHELHFPSYTRHRPVCLRDAVAFFVKNAKLSVLSALRSTRLRPAPCAVAVR